MNAITRQIAYPDFVENNSELDKFYEDVSYCVYGHTIVVSCLHF